MIKEEKPYKDVPITHKEKFRCKKCNEWHPVADIHPLIVLQRNKPIEFEHMTFSSKAEVIICKDCYKGLLKS